MAALEGMRVLDMTQYEAGTSCTQYLAWLGADVVKVEPPTGDPGRYSGRGLDGHPGDPQYFMNYSGNKKSIVLNLKSARGRELLIELAKQSDVFAENYGPGVVEALDIGPDVLCEVNPRLIYVRVKGFGLSGPYSGYNVYDWVAQAAAGTFSTTGEADGPPMIVGPTIADSGTGIQAALGVVAAYVEQQRTGQGQVIELSMQEATTMFVRTLDLPVWGKAPAGRMGTWRGRGVGGLYPCRGEGPNEWIFLFPVTTQMFDALCAAIGRLDLLEDERFATPQARLEHGPLVRAEIEKWTRDHDKREAMQILAGAGVPCSYVFDTLDLFTDPHLEARDFIVEVDHPDNGTVKLMRHPLRMRGVVPQERSPLLGEHTREVLASTLGFDETALDALEADGITKGALRV
jgi:formyl-CoA transferase